MPIKPLNAFKHFKLGALSALIAALLISAFVSIAAAQEKPTDEIKALIDAASAQLNQIEATLNRDGLSNKEFDDLKAQLDQIISKTDSAINRLQPNLTESKARLAALNPKAAEGDKQDKSPQPQADESQETEALTKKREELATQVRELESRTKLLSASKVRAEQLAGRITLARQDRFTSQLFERTGTLLNPALWAAGLAGLLTTWKAALILISDWLAFLSDKASDKVWQVTGMIGFLALMIIGPLRYALFTGISKLARLQEPTALQKSLHAVWSIIVYTIVPFAVFAGITLILDNANLLPNRIEKLAELLLSLIFIISLSYGTIRVLLAPKKAPYRLLRFDDSDALKLFNLSLLLLVIYAFQELFEHVSEILLSPLETTILVRGITAITIAFIIWTGMRMVIAATLKRPPVVTAEGPQPPSGFTLPNFIRILRPVIWLGCLVIIVSPILGYVSLGGFLSEQLGRILLVLALLGILAALIDNFVFESLERDEQRVQKIGHSLGIQPKTVSQFGVLLNGLTRILLYTAAALLIFAPWGVQSTDFLSSLQNAIFNIKIGDLNISPINILGAILVFVVALVLVKAIQHWMERRLLPSTNLDTGLKNSIITSIGYVGFILAAMLAFSYMGLDLSNIALVAGALSVGIGFGLQSIVNNFVSGLILLVERPIKTGDWVVVGADQGYVKKISVRATKIETFDRATVIVPNSDLISNRVMNWMHNGSMGRIIVPVGVSYDADPDQVREILLDVANESEHVTSYPEPRVYFMDFGASSLDFQLRCYIQDIDSSLTAKSALRFAIFRAMKQANIEIPFPQQDIHVRSITGPEAEFEPEQLQQPKPTRRKRSSQPEELDTGTGEPDGDA